MKKPFTLYGRPGSGSLAVQVALEEIGVPYERIWVGAEPAEVARDVRHGRIMEALQLTLKAKRSRLKDSAFFLQTRTLGLVKNHQQRLVSAVESIHRSPGVRFKESRKTLIEAHDNLKKIIHLHLQNSRTKIRHYHDLAQMADPKNTLKRGFSVTRSREGHLIRSIKDAEKFKDITTQLVDGIINSEIK